MKHIIYIVALLTVVMLNACVDDDGNYDYHELPTITVEGVPETMEILSHVDHIRLTPKIVSSDEGEIKPGNDNFEVTYKLGYKGMGALGGADSVAMKTLPWVDLPTTDGYDLDVPADYAASTYVLWMQIKDKRNNVVTDKTIDIKINGTTSDGWLVLCNEGSDEKVRLDMISQLTSTRIETLHNIISGMPQLNHATGLGFVCQMANPGDIISVFSKTGAYELDNETMESGEERNFQNIEFAMDPGTHIIKESTFASSAYSWQCKYRFAFDDEGNVYLQDQSVGGSAYGWPLNTTEAGSAAQFKVAPYCGFSWQRPWSSRAPSHVIFYDTTNRRFMAFEGTSDFSDAIAQMSPIGDNDHVLFDYTTGKDFVYMEGTRRSGGLVYAILQAQDGTRSIYGINVSGNQISQEMYIDAVDAPDFGSATHFAFDTRFPLLFYATDTKAYVYNLATRTAKQLDLGLKAGEEITLMKFNLFRASDYSSLVNQSEAFLNKQYQLVVATYDTSASGNDNGKVTLYNVDGAAETVSQAEQYSGFAKVVDVVYRERTE